MRGFFTLGALSFFSVWGTTLALACIDPTPSPVPLPPGFTQLSYGRTVYVSSSKGNDMNLGTLDQPLKTLPAGFAKLGSNTADSVLLARGDTFNLSAEAFLGRSGTVAQKAILGAYGIGARPIVTPYGLNLTKTLSHVAIQGIHFLGTEAVNDSAIRYVGASGSDFLIEDNEFDGPYFQSLAFDAQGASFTNLQLRRNVFHDAWGKTYNDFSQCAYIANVNGLTVYENLFDHCGYTGPTHDAGTIFNHALYAQTSTTGMVSQGNLITRNQDAYQMRQGGLADHNFFYGNAIHLTYKQSTGTISNNVMLHANDINANNPRGVGISLDVKNPQDPGNQLTITNNQIGFYDSVKPYGMAIAANGNSSVITASLNQWWGFPQGMWTQGSAHVTQNGNAAMTHPPKDIGDYLSAIGVSQGNISTFVNLVKLQSSQNWNQALTGEAVTAWFLSH